jgi:hypothetical protein
VEVEEVMTTIKTMIATMIETMIAITIMRTMTMITTALVVVDNQLGMVFQVKEKVGALTISGGKTSPKGRGGVIKKDLEEDNPDQEGHLEDNPDQVLEVNQRANLDLHLAGCQDPGANLGANLGDNLESNLMAMDSLMEGQVLEGNLGNRGGNRGVNREGNLGVQVNQEIGVATFRE